ncbi:phosphatase PAP2 family protein [Leucobacter insecticola]|uniref:Phosphatase PAP2 family protein n=1 Tax=Leucobacter insecticola TaxID=2714934 RepID=A0A6G8FJ24_9MICO|nr:phosphatase PAP2 family protein [Leucobacter insecticola]QIM16062.1 phosphatase PAP2 family protein [Leucobacter insecticola]
MRTPSAPIYTPQGLARLRTATAWAIVGLVVVAAVGAYFRFVNSGPLGIDEWWHGVATVSHGSAPYAVAVFMANIGDRIGVLASAAILVALLLALRRFRDAVTVATTMLLGLIGSEALKSLVSRPRPWDQLYASHGHSFPSGHSMGAAALAVSIALVVTYSGSFSRNATRWVWAVSVCWILVMMWSRTAVHVHWLSDTLAGAILGASVAIIARRLCLPKEVTR